MEMIEQFPALSGPYAASRGERTADYCIGYHLIYIAISFDKQAIHERTHELAGKHHLGLFEASSPDGELWLPGTDHELVLASKHEHRLPSPTPVTDPRIAALVRSHPPDGVIVHTAAQAENPRRTVNVFYSSRWPEAVIHRFGQQGTLAQLESDLARAGIAYAIVEQDEDRAFAGHLDEAISAARSVSSES
jgi:hypothetical protein